MTAVKQVIVLRKDLNMRKGKMVAQGAHASLQAYVMVMAVKPTVAIEWFRHLSTKICIGVDSEKELHDIYEKACEHGLLSVRIRDAGKTEFNEPTWTAVAIGPANAEEIDKVTGHLKLL
jgi:PTH2 family peptidyl-tRNA hydrolase